MDSESFSHFDLESILQDPSAQPYDLRLQYLRDITDDFSSERELGRGGFGVVYKGMLPNGKMIAVKNLVSLSEVQEKQFKNEVDNLMRVRHQNIVRFLGYCYETWLKYTDYNGKHVFAERPKRLLCFEYMPKGSLDKYISDESSGLDWHSRYKIIKGICCGLHYLHEECQTNSSLIHLDLKPANILLDENMEPKITDFGLSKLFENQKVETCATTIAGSHGYMAPEYICSRIITTKADIYSLGVIIIEMITGSRISPYDINETSFQDFVESVLGKWRHRLQETPGHASQEIECQQIETCLQIGLNCINSERMRRPETKDIIENLRRWESTDCCVRKEGNSHEDKVDNLRRQATNIVSTRLGRAEPPLQKEILSTLFAAAWWFDQICHWRNPLTTILIHVLFEILVIYPELILPTIFLYLILIGVWIGVRYYRWRPRQPPHIDICLSHAETAHPDEQRLRNIAVMIQTAVGDLLTQGERLHSLLSWRDPKATALFMVFCFIATMVLYVTPFRVVVSLPGLYVLRHPRFRHSML